MQRDEMEIIQAFVDRMFLKAGVSL